MTDTDPTKIDINFDPREQRMRGVAYHGNTPFDVPFISQIHGDLWQGGCESGLILPDFFTGIVSLYPWERYKIGDNVERVEIRMYDSLEQDTDQVDSIAEKVIELLDDGPTLVHCQAGLNRSSLIAGRVLMLKHGYTGQEAVDLLRTQRSPACLCNPSFEQYFHDQDSDERWDLMENDVD